MGRCAVISYVPEKRNYQDHSYRRKIGKGDRFGSWAAILCMPAVSVFIVTAFFFWDSRVTLNNFALAAGALILCGSILHANGEWQEYFVVESYLTWYPLVEKNVEGVFLKGGAGPDNLLPPLLRSAGLSIGVLGFSVLLESGEEYIPVEITIGFFLAVAGLTIWAISLWSKRRQRSLYPGDIVVNEKGLSQQYGRRKAAARWEDLNGRFTLVKTRRNEIILKLALRPTPGWKSSIDLWVSPVTSNASILVDLVRLCYRDPSMRDTAALYSRFSGFLLP